MFSFITLPENTMSGLGGVVSDVFNSFSSPITWIVALIAGFWLMERIIGIVQDVYERRQERTGERRELLKHFGVPASMVTSVEKRINPQVYQALGERLAFQEHYNIEAVIDAINKQAGFMPQAQPRERLKKT